MDELDRFQQLIIEALSNVSQSYYTTVYRNADSFREALEGRQGEFVDDDFERYSERVFCYEFYHQLRKMIDEERVNSPAFMRNAELQGEVEKMNIIGLIERFGIESLSKEFIPDFLMHSPGDVISHPMVIEVKSVNNLSASALLYDLEKLDEFITRYNYQRGLFISVNAETEYILRLIDRQSENISRIEARDRIIIIIKQNQESEPIIYRI